MNAEIVLRMAAGGCTTSEQLGRTETGNARYSVHKRRKYFRKQGGTVEYIYMLHP